MPEFRTRLPLNPLRFAIIREIRVSFPSINPIAADVRRAELKTVNRIENENEEDEQRFMKSLVLLRTCIGTMNVAADRKVRAPLADRNVDITFHEKLL